MSTSVGYMGGHFENPCYLDVLSRITGHAEVCQVEYDPAIVNYKALLDVFWTIHYPTSLNWQGADRGEQYRSVIFYYTAQQAGFLPNDPKMPCPAVPRSAPAGSRGY